MVGSIDDKEERFTASEMVRTRIALSLPMFSFYKQSSSAFPCNFRGYPALARLQKRPFQRVRGKVEAATPAPRVAPH